MGPRAVLPSRLRSPQAWRLGSGLVLFVFVLTHLLNHALGHVSLEAMEAVQVYRRAFWGSPPGTLLLYGAVAVHVGLAFLKVVRRRTWRMAPWEAAQIGLGLLVLLYGARHATATRLLGTLYGVSDDYAVVLRRLWPGTAVLQTILIAAAWLHAVIGLHQWLNTKPGYARWRDLLLVVAVLVPTLAATGWIEAARGLQGAPLPAGGMTDEQRNAATVLSDRAELAVWLVFALLLAVIVGFRAWRWFRRGPPVAYAGGRTVRAPPGATLLEVSRLNGIPHASVCGGRGRCTTCRVLVMKGAEDLAAPNPVEADALARIHAPKDVRLACQLRPTQAIMVNPLIAAKRTPLMTNPDPQAWGVEERITILFADLRDFTSLAERLYPYDAVFLLNRYGEVMGDAIERHGGKVDKFLGDGVMALFGIGPGPDHGGRSALLAARDMFAALDRLNHEFARALANPLRMGIGVHTGFAVLGCINRGREAELTALGDSVNVASRLEGLNKEFGSVLVASHAVLEDAGLAIPGSQTREIPLRGRRETLRVVVAARVDSLEESPAETLPT